MEHKGQQQVKQKKQAERNIFLIASLNISREFNSFFHYSKSFFFFYLSCVEILSSFATRAVKDELLGFKFRNPNTKIYFKFSQSSDSRISRVVTHNQLLPISPREPLSANLNFHSTPISLRGSVFPFSFTIDGISNYINKDYHKFKCLQS